MPAVEPAQILEVVQQAWPETRFHVQSTRGGNRWGQEPLVRVCWVDGPTRCEVESVLGEEFMNAHLRGGARVSSWKLCGLGGVEPRRSVSLQCVVACILAGASRELLTWGVWETADDEEIGGWLPWREELEHARAVLEVALSCAPQVLQGRASITMGIETFSPKLLQWLAMEGLALGIDATAQVGAGTEGARSPDATRTL